MTDMNDAPENAMLTDLGRRLAGGALSDAASRRFPRETRGRCERETKVHGSARPAKRGLGA